jgi:AmmeMemoRadiSam system protein A
VGSALRDPRFYPVGPHELPDLQIELSVLTKPQLLSYDGPDDLLEKIRPGIDGIMVEMDFRRATLLPSVWEKIPEPDRFLSTVCLKAGLREDEWRSGKVTVHVYQAEKLVAA